MCGACLHCRSPGYAGAPALRHPQENTQGKRKRNTEEIQNTVVTWLIRHVPLMQHPWSLNMYLYPKLFHRCHTELLRKTDINKITKQLNRFLFADKFEKPGLLVQFLSKDEGGLGLHSIKEKKLCFLSQASWRLQFTLIFSATDITKLYLNSM